MIKLSDNHYYNKFPIRAESENICSICLAEKEADEQIDSLEIEIMRIRQETEQNPSLRKSQ